MTSLLVPVVLALAFASAQQVPISGIDKLKVAGRNPFFYCNDPDPYTLQIASIDITPHDSAEWRPYVPPASCAALNLAECHASGHNITVEIDGHNQQIIEQGAIVDISIMKRDLDGTWGALQARQQDLCLDLKTMFGEDCPVRSGVSTESRNFTIPPETPRGDYYLVIDAHTRFKEQITCVYTVVSL